MRNQYQDLVDELEYYGLFFEDMEYKGGYPCLYFSTTYGGADDETLDDVYDIANMFHAVEVLEYDGMVKVKILD